MTEDDFRLEPRSLVWPLERFDLPLAVVDLDKATLADLEVAMPPFPVVGIGDPANPLAAKLDALLEPPIALESVLHQVRQQPRAAAVAVQLLRMVRQLPVEDALVSESLAYGLLQGGAEHAAWLTARPVAAERPARGEVLLDRDGGVLTITMARPGANNAVDRVMRDGLREAFELAALDPDIACVRLRGAGRTFSVGADLDEFGITRDPVEAHAIRMQTLPAHAIARCAGKLHAHVQGACVGAGLEMAGFARRLTATRRAWFHLPELAMGLLPGAGGCVSLARRIGRQRTALLLLSGRRIGVATALEWGLVDAIVDDDSADEGQAHVLGNEP